MKKSQPNDCNDIEFQCAYGAHGFDNVFWQRDSKTKLQEYPRIQLNLMMMMIQKYFNHVFWSLARGDQQKKHQNQNVQNQSKKS